MTGRWRGIALLIVISLLGTGLTGFGPAGIVESSAAADPVYADQIPLAQRLAQPGVGARAVAIVDDATGQLLYGQNEHQRLPMASTTKIMTALVALERGRLDQTFTIDVNAADMPDSSVMGLTPGERLTLLDLLYGMLLPSGNDAALAIARAIGGSESAFVDMMNRRAAELGLKDTHFANPHGLDDPNHYTSAADLAQLARIALGNPTFAQIVSTQEKTVRGRATYDLKNTDRLLSRPDVEGVKTGTTDLAGSCFVGAIRRDGSRVITAVLNSPDYSVDTLALADYAYAAYSWPTLDLPVSPFDEAPGEQRPALGSVPSVVLPAWQVPLLRVETGDGQVDFVVAGKTVATAPLVRLGPDLEAR